ncbi:MAG: helix-turn-helix domain-containing protein [Inquilinus sp.]|uniref:helix-turn-helix domain-containing protein n=1 Tax=Inquilinus sp. TaxID=1932117 RepID=UPI003F373860
MFVNSAIQRVRDYRCRHGWTLSQLARAAGLRESTIRKLDDDDWNPTVSTLRALERVTLLPPFDQSLADPAEIGGEAASGHSLGVGGIAVVHDAAIAPAAASLPREQP